MIAKDARKRKQDRQKKSKTNRKMGFCTKYNRLIDMLIVR